MNRRRILILENPKSGQAVSTVPLLLTLLAERGAEVELRTLDVQVPCSDHLHDLKSFDALVAAGGDGTVSSVAYAAKYSGVPILAYPAGTANLITQNLNLPPDPPTLADVLLHAEPVLTDLAELRASGETQGFTLIAGTGLDAQMILESEDLKPRLGVAAYFVSALKQLAPKQVRFTLDLDGGRRIETEGISVLIANFGMINFRLPVTQGIDPADGRFTVVVLKGKSPLSLVPTAIDSLRSRLNLGDPLFQDNLETYESREVTVHASEGLPIEYDGEVMNAELPLHARVLPGATLFLTPGTREDLST